jgi:hypothetical protein
MTPVVRHAAAAAVFVAALTGCHHDGATSGDPSNNERLPHGSVVGTFDMVGGPYPGIDRPLGGSIDIHRTSRSGAVVKTIHTSRRGHFDTLLAPGRYWLIGRSPHVTGMGCPNVHAVTVTDHGTAHVQVVCAVP